MKRLIVLALIVTLATATAFANAANEESTAGGEMPSKLSFKVYAPHFGEEPHGRLSQVAFIDELTRYMGMELDIDWEMIVWGDYGERMNIYLASGDYADVFQIRDRIDELNNLGDNGQILDLNEYKGQWPNYQKFIDAGFNRLQAETPDGKLYSFFQGKVGVAEGTQFMWTYRFDTFQDNGIDIPTTLPELYEAAKTLKRIYPDSFPLGSPFSGGGFSLPNVFFKVNRTSESVYWNGTEYVYGPIDDSDRLKEVVEYLNKFYEEGLLDPEFFTLSQDQAQERILNGTYFIIPNTYSGRVEGRYNSNTNFDGSWGAAVRPKSFDGLAGWKLGTKYNGNTLGTLHNTVISSDTEYPELMIKLVDYTFNPKMIEIANWGVEGETFEWVDGRRKYTSMILDADDVTAAKKAVALHGSCRTELAAQNQIEKFMDDFSVQPVFANGRYFEDGLIKFTAEQEGPESIFPNDRRPPTPLSADERELQQNVVTTFNTYFDENLIKFIIGDRPISDWDKFVEQLGALGDMDGLLKVLNARAQESLAKMK